MVKIDKDLLKKLEKRAKEAGSFKNVDEYINYILKQVIERLERKKAGEEADFSEEDEKKAKEMLKKLGYID
ncbi:CopG family transcriptional regulator [Candidatus Woesearchaeota archaeon]|nr:CopG family transcriptional regulator [Candidatus Woesearchaeota archaeon]